MDNTENKNTENIFKEMASIYKRKFMFHLCFTVLYLIALIQSIDGTITLFNTYTINGFIVIPIVSIFLFIHFMLTRKYNWLLGLVDEKVF
jgi:hypothetical protein